MASDNLNSGHFGYTQIRSQNMIDVDKNKPQR
jgi:hypothetical protein